MTLLTAVAVTIVVWLVSLVRAVPLRALIYSLPLPMSVVLLSTGTRVGAAQIVGVLLLNVFVAVVAWLHRRCGWHILAADAAGVAAYIVGSWVALPVGRWPYLPVLAAALALWVAELVRRRRRSSRPPTPALGGTAQRAPDGAGRAVGKLAVLGAGALLMVWLGGLLRGMVVTFPYSGVLVVVESRRDLVEFRGEFARNSIGLLAFVTGYHYAQDISRPVAFAAGWAAFLCCAIVLYRTRHRSPARPEAQSTHAGLPGD